MYQEQIKTVIHDSIVVVDTEITMKKRYIIENILDYLFKESINKYNLTVNLNNVLYITDGYDTEPLNITFEKKDVKVETKSFLKFTKELFNEKDFSDLYFSKSIIIIGCINRMDPSVLDMLIRIFNSHLVVLYGDTSLSYQDEFKSFYSNLFTNTKLDISEIYTSDTYDINRKKIYNVINKIRKGIEPDKLSISSIFNIKEDNRIDINYIQESIENEDNAIILPETYYNEVNSLIYQNINNTTELIPSINTEFYNVYPLIVKDSKGNIDIIPAFSKIVVTSDPMTDLCFHNNKVFIDLTISYNDKIYYSVPFDFSFYLNNFSSENHPEHKEVFDIINSIDQRFNTEKIDYTTIKAIPFKILKSLYVKQTKFKNIKVYNLTISPIDFQSLVNNNLYSSICTATDSIEIIESPKFIIE